MNQYPKIKPLMMSIPKWWIIPNDASNGELTIIQFVFINLSGQIIICHQPRFPWNKRTSLTKPPFGVRSCEVAIICPDLYLLIPHYQQAPSTMEFLWSWWPKSLPSRSLTVRPWKVTNNPIGSQIVFLSHHFSRAFAVKLREGNTDWFIGILSLADYNPYITR